MIVPNKDGKNFFLSGTELQIVKSLSKSAKQKGEATVSDVRHQLLKDVSETSRGAGKQTVSDSRRASRRSSPLPTYTGIKIMLDRLVDKGMLASKERSRRLYYAIKPDLDLARAHEADFSALRKILRYY